MHIPVHPTAIAVAKTATENQFGHRSAKSKFLKAIDFTIGLVRRMDNMGYKFADAPFPEVLKRLIILRKKAQSEGLTPQDIEPLMSHLQGKALSILDRAGQREKEIIPKPAHWKAFFKTFGDKGKLLRQIQSGYLHDLIATRTGEDEGDIAELLMEDEAFFKRAYSIVLPTLKTTEGRALRVVGKHDILQHRVKSEKSCWGKQHGRKGAPFTTFGDLVGLRIVVTSFPELAEVAAQVQKKLRVISKSNRYFIDDQYNAMNYKLEVESIGVELQVKTKMNLVEAQISHDLIYSPEKSVLALSPRERELVGLTISASTLVGLQEFADAMRLSDQ